jgi:hypothetical protein
MNQQTNMLRLLQILVIVVCMGESTAFAQQKVELELVLALDSSTSVNADEYELQRKGLSEAMRHPSVLRAIRGLGEEGLAISVVQWSGPGKQVNSVPWRHINNEAAALKLAQELANMPRALTGFTDIAGAINFSVASIERNAFDGRRYAIDVSGDGTSDNNNPSAARDAAVAKGFTINGLIIHSVEYDLGDLARHALHTHYQNDVIGGPGAFLLHAENFKTFGESMRQKLVKEITGPLFANLRHQSQNVTP